MSTMFRGEAIYTAEVDAHFPRAPRIVPGGVTREKYAAHLRDVSFFITVVT